MARSYCKFFLARTRLISPKCTNSRPNVQIPCQNVQIPCHGEENVIIIPCPELLVRKKSKYFFAGVSWQEKIWFFDPRNSGETPPSHASSHQMVSREKPLWLTPSPPTQRECKFWQKWPLLTYDCPWPAGTGNTPTPKLNSQWVGLIMRILQVLPTQSIVINHTF